MPKSSTSASLTQLGRTQIRQIAEARRLLSDISVEPTVHAHASAAERKESRRPTRCSSAPAIQHSGAARPGPVSSTVSQVHAGCKQKSSSVGAVDQTAGPGASRSRRQARHRLARDCRFAAVAATRWTGVGQLLLTGCGHELPPARTVAFEPQGGGRLTSACDELARHRRTDADDAYGDNAIARNDLRRPAAGSAESELCIGKFRDLITSRRALQSATREVTEA